MDVSTDAADILRLSDERFRIMADVLKDHALIMIDPAGRVRTWTSAAASIFGYQPDEIIGEHCRAFESLENRERGLSEQELATAAEHGTASDDRWLSRKSGEAFYANGTSTAIFSEDHRLLGFLKVVRDQTALRKLEDDLRSQRDRFEFAQEVANLGTFEWNIVTDQEVWTSGMYRLYDIPQGRTIATYQDWLALVHPDDVEMVEKAFAEAVAYHRRAALEFRIIHPNGTTHWIAVAGKAIYDDHGKPLRFVGVQADIDYRKNAEVALSDANRELQQFAQIASHDLQEPLRMITSYLHLLTRRYNDRLDADGREYVRYAIDGAERLRRMITGWLELVKYEHKPLRVTRVACRHLVSSVVEDLRARLAETGGVVQYGDLPEIMADGEHLERVFQNLIGNALKYHREGVTPVVRVEARRDNDQEWIFSISDNGVGIPPQDRERVFSTFHRLHGRDISGSGIGLSICKKIIDRHGGRIWVDSTPGSGSTFGFAIPIAPQDRE